MTDRHLHRIGLLLLPILSFIAYNWVFDYVIVLQYQTNYCFFMFSREFLAQFLDRPGGLLTYAGRFLGQFYHYTWLGALIVSALITCFGAAFFVVLTRLRRAVSIFHTLFPCTLLLVLHYLVKDGTIGLIVTCVAFLGYLSLRGAVSRRVYALVVTSALYLVIGGYFWLFVAWVTASEWLDSPLSSNIPFKLLYPALSACLPLAASRWLFPISLSNALTWPVVIAVPYSALHLILCAYLLLMPFWARVSWGRRAESFWGSRRGVALQAACLILLAVSLPSIRYDQSGDRFADYHQLYKRRQWDAILAKSKKDPSPQLMTQFFTNRALYHKGRLLEEMFNDPQLWGSRGLVLNFFGRGGRTSPDMDLHGALYNSDLFLEMGHMNAAYRLAYNHIPSLGKTYDSLRRIAECNMVNGNYHIAEKYLNILERTAFHKEFARHCKAIIADTNAADRRFAQLRTLLPTVELDMYCGNFVPALTLLKSNAQNRMALDYLIAWCLLDKISIPMIAENLRYFKEAGYTSLPAHCQEALMVLEKSTGTTVDKHGFTYDPDTVSRFRMFDQQMSLYRDRSIAQRELKATFGGTYMYYCVFADTPSEKDADSQWLLGNAFYSLGMLDDAVSRYRHALRIEPQFAEAHTNLGNVLMSQGRDEEAAFHYREALRIKPDSGEAADILDRIMQMQSH